MQPVLENDTDDLTVPVEADAAKHRAASNLTDVAKSGNRVALAGATQTDSISGGRRHKLHDVLMIQSMMPDHLPDVASVDDAYRLWEPQTREKERVALNLCGSERQCGDLYRFPAWPCRASLRWTRNGRNPDRSDMKVIVRKAIRWSVSHAPLGWSGRTHTSRSGSSSIVNQVMPYRRIKTVLPIASRMRQRGFQIGDAGQEDGVRLMVMVGEEDELVPVVLAGTELQELVKGFGFAVCLHADHVASSGNRSSRFSSHRSGHRAW